MFGEIKYPETGEKNMFKLLFSASTLRKVIMLWMGIISSCFAMDGSDMSESGNGASVVIKNLTDKKAIFELRSERGHLVQTVVIPKKDEFKFGLPYRPRKDFPMFGAEEVQEIVVSFPEFRRTIEELFEFWRFKIDPLKINTSSLYDFELTSSGDTYLLTSCVATPKLSYNPRKLKQKK